MSQLSNQTDTIIVGAGIAGLALAVALGRVLKPNFSVILCDPILSREPAADDRVSAIAEGAKRLLEVLDVWQSISARAQPIHGMVITDSRLNDAMRPSFLTFEEDSASTQSLAYMVEHRDLSIALRNACHEVGVQLIPKGIETFEIGEGYLDAILKDGNSIATKLLVAADGARSKLRSAAGISCVSQAYNQSGIVATIGHERDHNGRAMQHFLPAGTFAILPLIGKRSSIVWVEATEEADRIIALAPGEFKEELLRRFGRQLGEIEVLSLPRAYPLSFSVARRFIGERFALLGDSAHVVHPLAGQGLNLGLRDVAALAECVADFARLGLDPGSPDMLKRYERWRRADAVSMAGMTYGLNSLFSNDSSLLRVVRDVGLGLVDRSLDIKQYFARQAAGITGELPRLMRGEMP